MFNVLRFRKTFFKADDGTAHQKPLHEFVKMQDHIKSKLQSVDLTEEEKKTTTMNEKNSGYIAVCSVTFKS